jgi:diguanylate cyclase (GGDEF)-like protein
METPDRPSDDAAEIERTTIDALTQLASRAGFDIQARHALVVCRRLRLPATLLFFGLDRPEAMRESLGDAEADRTLVAFADAMRKVVRGSDILCHRGGGVFAALLIDCSAAATPYVLARLRTTLTSENAGLSSGNLLDFSIGGAEFDPERHSTIGQLLDDADAEMYSQKHGRE